MGDINRGGREAYGLGLATARAVSENRLNSLRSQAQLLQAAARIQSLETANTMAQVRLVSTAANLDMAQQRLKLANDVAQQKSTDLKGYLEGWRTLSAQDRQALDELNPEWLSTGPNAAQQGLLSDKMRAAREEQAAILKAQGMTPTRTTVIEPGGGKTVYEPTTSDQVHYINGPDGQPRWFTWKGNVRDLGSLTDVQRQELHIQAQRLNTFLGEASKDTSDADKARRARIAQDQMDALINKYRWPAVPQGATLAPGAASVPVPQPTPSSGTPSTQLPLTEEGFNQWLKQRQAAP